MLISNVDVPPLIAIKADANFMVAVYFLFIAGIGLSMVPRYSSYYEGCKFRSFHPLALNISCIVLVISITISLTLRNTIIISAYMVSGY